MTTARRLTEQELTQLQELRAQGWGYRRISKHLACSREAVRYRLMGQTARHHVLARSKVNKRHRDQRRFIQKLEALTQSLTDRESGYLSGIIDGEGCLRLYHNARSGWMVSLVIVNTNRELIDYIKNLLQAGKCYFSEARNARWKSSYRIQLYSTTLRWLLPQLKLIVKREQAAVLIEALRLLKGRCNTEQYRQELTRLAARMKELNHRGPACLTLNQ